MRPGGDPVQVGPVLQQLLAKLHLEERKEAAGLLTDWAVVVGPEVARVTRPHPPEGGRMWVEVESSAWLMEVTLRRRELLEAINRHLGQGRVRELRFRLKGR